MRTQASVDIDRPIGDVFEYANNHVPEWSITVVEDEPLETTPEQVGSTFRCVTENHRGQRMEFQGEVTHYERPVRSAVYMTGQQFDIAAEYGFDDLGNRTRVTIASVVYPKGFTKVFFFLCGWMFRTAGCKAQQAELASLKRLLEEGAGQVT